MPLRPRTARRLGFALLSVALLGATAGFVQERAWARQARRLLEVRAAGLGDLAVGDHDAALARLGEYVAESDAALVARDAPGRLAYALARAMVPAPGGRHLDQAGRMLADLAHDEGEAEPVAGPAATARLRLLRRAGAWPQLLAAAEETLRRDAGDVPALRAKRDAAEQTGDLATALATALALAERRPGDVDDQVQAVRLAARQVHRQPDSGEALVARVVAARQARPDLALPLLLPLAVAHDAAGQHEQAAACLDLAAAEVAAAPSPEPLLVARLCGMFDALGRHAKAGELVEIAAAAAPDDAPLAAMLAWRRWSRATSTRPCRPCRPSRI